MGFTLLELLVVVAIIGVLASYIGPKYFSHIGKTQVQATRAQLDALSKALDAYRLDVGTYPRTDQSLAALIERPANEAKWNGPYLRGALPSDPWGHAYQYRAPGTGNHDFEVWSFGRDRRSGGSGEDADIVLAQ